LDAEEGANQLVELEEVKGVEVLAARIVRSEKSVKDRVIHDFGIETSGKEVVYLSESASEVAFDGD